MLVDHTAAGVFLATLLGAMGLAIFARIRATNVGTAEGDLAGRGLNRWLIGLSAGATGNSGFIITAAVGLGYSGGLQWLLLPVSWLVGDLVFWKLFPSRINSFARKHNVTTISEFLSVNMNQPHKKIISATSAILLTGGLLAYAASQWIAGQKILEAGLEISSTTSLLLIGGTIIAYSAIGGFRGSVYVDTLQAIISIVGCLIVLAVSAYLAVKDPASFLENTSNVPSDYWSILPDGSLIAASGFVLGFVCASIGFGLGQPQITSRYFAGSSPEETANAKWIYIGFLQFTWISMTIFGILLRGIVPEMADPEAGLSYFAKNYLSSIGFGLVLAYMYAIIASTINSIIVSVAQTVKNDLVGILIVGVKEKSTSVAMLLTVGILSLIVSAFSSGTVFAIAVGAVSKIAAGLAGPMIIKIMNWRHSGGSIISAMIGGISVSFLWSSVGLSGAVNESAIGIFVGLALNWVVYRAHSGKPASSKTL